jgi:colicin import membrane protein
LNAQLKEQPSTSMLPLVSIDAAVVFRDRIKLDDLLLRIRQETATLVPDVSTEEGRKLIASTAYKVARSKTAIDDAGKDLVEGWKNQAKVVDAERKHARDTLDALKDEIRAPLDAWQAEQDRIEQEAIEQARIRREKEEADRLAEIERRETAVREAEERIAADRRAEADRIAAEQAERDRIAREERIRQEAVDQAQRDAAESLQRAERQAEEAREGARSAAEKAERDRVAAEQRAADDQARAVREAEERADAQARAAAQARADEEARQRAEQERREANRRHVGAVHRKALAALVQHDVDELEGKRIIELIATGKVPAVSITY